MSAKSDFFMALHQRASLHEHHWATREHRVCKYRLQLGISPKQQCYMRLCSARMSGLMALKCVGIRRSAEAGGWCSRALYFQYSYSGVRKSQASADILKQFDLLTLTP